MPKLDCSCLKTSSLPITNSLPNLATAIAEVKVGFYFTPSTAKKFCPSDPGAKKHAILCYGKSPFLIFRVPSNPSLSMMSMINPPENSLPQWITQGLSNCFDHCLLLFCLVEDTRNIFKTNPYLLLLVKVS